MHGVIIELKAKTGDTVASGQVVAVIEAMKMMNEIARTRTAPSRKSTLRKAKRWKRKAALVTSHNMARSINDSGIPLEPNYNCVEGPAHETGNAGTFPFTRGVASDMYRGRLWTMRQYAGFASAAESNARYRYLLARGTYRVSGGLRFTDAVGTRLRCAPRAREVGKVGVAIDSVADVETLFKGIPLDSSHRFDDHQRARVHHFGDGVGRRTAAGIPFEKLGEPFKTMCSKSTWPAALTFSARSSMRLVTT